MNISVINPIILHTFLNQQVVNQPTASLHVTKLNQHDWCFLTPHWNRAGLPATWPHHVQLQSCLNVPLPCPGVRQYQEVYDIVILSQRVAEVLHYENTRPQIWRNYYHSDNEWMLFFYVQLQPCIRECITCFSCINVLYCHRSYKILMPSVQVGTDGKYFMQNRYFANKDVL